MPTISNTINMNRQIATNVVDPYAKIKSMTPLAAKPGSGIVVPFSFAPTAAQDNALMKARLSAGMTKTDPGPTMRGFDGIAGGGLQQPTVPTPAPGSELEEKRPVTEPIR